MDFGWAGTLVLVAAAGIVAGGALYLLVLALAALVPHAGPAPGEGRSLLVVLVPAHDEAELLPRCIASLRAQDYPADRRRLVVVADNCADDTAAVGAACGAEVMVRDEPGLRGKGRALRWAMDRLLAGPEPPDAVVVVDADTVADPGLLRALEAAAGGAEAVQAEYLVLDGGGPGTALRQAAFLLFHRTRFSGRAALGLPCTLVGNGMLLRRSLLERLPWSAFTGAEDLEYSMDLRLSGVRPRFTSAAAVAGPASGFGRAAATQRMRWEGGRLYVVRTRLPRLLAAVVRHRDWSLLDAALDLAAPPLGLLALLTLAGGAVTLAAGFAGAVRLWAAIPWGVDALLLAAYVLAGLRAAHAPPSAYRALLGAPRFLLAKLGTYLRMTRGLGADRWERTERPAEELRRRGPGGPRPCGSDASLTASPLPRRVPVCGVPIDPVDQAEAAERMLAAVGSGSLLQVSTVNLQFLVTARRRPEVRRALHESGLNVADGAPVVWLGRVLGCRLPGRVAGADLVPALMGRAAVSGARVFLLGGRDGVADEAAAVLRGRYPGLVVSGTYEPPLAPLEGLRDDDIVARIRDAGADILLVAFGHPKQDLWIAAHRARLPVSVAIGVGGTFDLIAGRFSRAPEWVRRSGLEWLYRLVQEPRRLALRYATCAIWLVGVLVPLAAWQRVIGGTPAAAIAGGDRVAIESEAGTAVS